MKTTTMMLLMMGVLGAWRVGAQPPQGGGEEGDRPRRERPFVRDGHEGPRRGPPVFPRNGGGPPSPPALDRLFEHLRQHEPEEFERLRTLRVEDPEGFRDELRRRVAETRVHRGEGPGLFHHPFQREVKALRSAETPEAREEALGVLRERLGEVLDRRMEMRQQRIQAIREELMKLQAQHEADLARREEILREQVERLLAEGAPPRPNPSPVAAPPPPPTETP